MTAFSSIVGAMKAALESAPAVSSSVTRSRTRPVDQDEADTVNIYFESAQPNRGAIHGAPIDWETRIVVELYARSATNADAAIDTLLGKVVDRLMGDSTLGGLVDDLGAPSVDTEYDANGMQTGWFRLTYPVQHRTANNTIA
jgi:hypothetical protein